MWNHPSQADFSKPMGKEFPDTVGPHCFGNGGLNSTLPGLCSKIRRVRLGYMQVVKVRLRLVSGLARKMGLFVLLVAH